MIPANVRAARPLVHAITNYVTMDWVARGLLAAGARPVMARDGAEAPAMAAAADALLLNLGTWSPAVHAAMLEAGRVASERGIPIVLDPVGAGAMPTRTKAALELLQYVKVTAIRGNAGEIAALAGINGGVRGVDSVSHTATDLVRKVAHQHHCIAIATGAVDILSDGHRTLEVKSGRPLMAQIPGAGCLASALVAASLSTANTLEAAAEALLWAGMAGELAGAVADGPGSFAPAFLDALANVDTLPLGRITPPLADRLALYVIVSGTTPLPVLEQILAAGAGTIQFREKHLPFRAQVPIARSMRELCHRHGALFLINDRADLALAVGADGLHLGQDDLPLAEARRLLGPEALLGATCETEDEARSAVQEGAGYIGTGPVYATPSKADAGEPYGPAVVGWVSRAAAPIPVIGIGGIGPGGAAPVIAAGGCGVAVISSVVNAPDPGAAARTLLAEIATAKGATNP